MRVNIPYATIVAHALLRAASTLMSMLGMRAYIACVALSLSTTTAASKPTLFENGRLIVDARKPPIENTSFIVDNGRITKIGKSLQAPKGADRVDLTGKTVIPALVNAHVHLGYQKDLTYSPDNFTRENLINELNRYAYAGVAVVTSLGTDLGDLPFQIRADQKAGRLGGALFLTAGHGFAAPNAGPNAPELKGSALGVTTEAEARRLTREQIARKVDVVKIWVDDRGGTVQKLSPALYRAIIDEAHKHGKLVMAHVYYLDDAKDLVRAGIDGFAHLARDKEMDDEVIALIKQRNVYIVPNLTIGENAAQPSPPAWLDDPLAKELTPASVLARLRTSFTGRTPEAVARAQAAYRMQQRSLAKLNAAGARIGFGTDAGAARDVLHAYNDHRELQRFVDAGLTRAQALTAATVTSADFLKLPQYGTLDPRKSADFVVLDANPLDDIANTRKISRVYLRGQEIDRAALRASPR